MTSGHAGESRDSETAASKRLDAALATLGVRPGASWQDLRTAYRRQLRMNHPDLDDHTEDATERTARLNVAWGTIVDVTDGGRLPLPQPAPVQTARRSDSPVTLRAGPGDVFVQLLDAAYEVGDVSYIDPEAGLIQVLLDQGGPAASQLLIDVHVDTEPQSATFTLDSMQAEHAPELRAIVDHIAEHLQG